MTHVEQALEKLPEAALESLTQAHDTLAAARFSELIVRDSKARVDGYLHCLMDMGLLDPADVGPLRTYFKR